MNIDDINYYIPDDTRIIKWHVTDDNELDYTIYTEEDGGRLDLSDDVLVSQIQELLEELL